LTAITATTTTALHAIFAARRPWLVCSASRRSRCAAARPSAPTPVPRLPRSLAGSWRSPRPESSAARPCPRPVPPKAKISDRTLNSTRRRAPVPMMGRCQPPCRRSTAFAAMVLPDRACTAKILGRNALHRETALPPTEPAGAATGRTGKYPLQSGTVRPDTAPQAGPLSATELRRHAPLTPGTHCKNPGRNALHRDAALPPTAPAAAATPRVPASTLCNACHRALVPVVARCDRAPWHKPDCFRHPTFAATCRTGRARNPKTQGAMPYTARLRRLPPNRQAQPRRVPASTLTAWHGATGRHGTSLTASGIRPSPRRAPLAGREIQKSRTQCLTP
jgi:hypothetical protein